MKLIPDLCRRLLTGYFNEAGKISSVIDRTYPLSELAAAHTHSETERTVGKIAIAVAS